MRKILIILSGVLLIYSEPVVAKNEITIASTIKVAKNALKNKKTVQKKKYKSVKNSKKKAHKSVKKTSQKKKKVKSAKKKVIKKKAIKKTKYNYRYNVGEIQHYMNVLNAEYGWSNDDYIAWLMIVKRESSFNPYAVNKKSGATGLCQALPGKKMASHGKDWRTNYKTQLKWCRDYIRNRYKTPSQAWSFWQSHHWF